MKTILIALICFTASVSARIGETLPQCLGRYGNSFAGAGTSWRRFETSGLVIIVALFEGKVERIAYQKQSTGFLGRPDPLSANEINLLRQSNFTGEWKPFKPTPDADFDLQSADGRLLSSYSKLGNQLVIETADRVQRVAAEAKRLAEQKAAEQKASETRMLKGL